MTFLDPAFFGDFESFCNRYDLEVDSRGTVQAFPNDALKKIRADLQRGAHMLSMRRSNWIHLLPEREEKRHTVRLSPTLQKFYNAIWQALVEQLTDPNNPMYDATVARAWERFQASDGDEDEEGKGEGRLLQQLIVVDQFLTCPTAPIGGALTKKVRNKETGEMEEVSRLDKIPPEFVRIRKAVQRMTQVDPKSTVSPKVIKAAEIIDKHFASPDAKLSDGTVGKVIVFAQHRASAEHFRKWLPVFSTALSTTDVVYYEGGMDATLEAFRTDPSIKVLCAVDRSLREGHNLQVANRAIRVDLLWSPGDMEQVFGRIFRPGSKASKVFIDTIVTEGTGEIAKLGRLLCKYHNMRKVNSDYSDPHELMPIRMTPDVMDPESTLDEHGRLVASNERAILELGKIQDYLDRYDDAYAFDMAEATRLSSELGSDMISGKSGDYLPGAQRIEGFVPLLDDEDQIIPFRVKKFPKKGRKPAYYVIDDETTMEYISTGDARVLRLKYSDDGASGFYHRKVARDESAWVEKIHEQGFTLVEITEMTAKGQPESIHVYDEDGDLVSTRKPGEPGPNDPYYPEGATPPTPEEPPTPEKPHVDTPKVQTVVVGDGWELVGIQDHTDVLSTPECYAIFRKPSKKGGYVYEAWWHYDDDAAVMYEDVLNRRDGKRVAKGVRSTKDPGESGIPEGALSKLQARIDSFEEDIEDIDWSWSAPHEHAGLVALLPEPKQEEPPPEQPASAATLPDDVIEHLGVAVFEGIPYIYVDSGEDDKEALRAFGLRWFNAFRMRPFANMTEARRIITDLGTHRVKLKNADDFLVEAKRVIVKRKRKKREEIARKQLQRMRRLRRKSKKVPATLYSLTIGDTHFCAIRLLEHTEVIARVRGTPRFTKTHSGYWMQCLNRSTAKRFVKALFKNGYQVVNWTDFTAMLEDTFSYTPDVDLSLRRRPEGRPPSEPVSGDDKVEEEEAVTAEALTAAINAVAIDGSEEAALELLKQASATVRRKVQKAVGYSDLEEYIAMQLNKWQDSDGGADPEDQPEPKPTATPPVPEEPSTDLRGQARRLYEKLEDLTEDLPTRKARRLWRKLYEPDDYDDIDDDEMLEEVELLKKLVEKHGGSLDEDPAPEPPPEESEREGPKLPPLPKVTDPNDPLHHVVSELQSIYDELGA